MYQASRADPQACIGRSTGESRLLLETTGDSRSKQKRKRIEGVSLEVGLAVAVKS